MGFVRFLNVSNNCYLNVCLQMMMCADVFCMEMVDKCGGMGLVSMLEMYNKKLGGEDVIINPMDVKKELSRYDVFFGMMGQQDAQECMVRLLDVLNDRCNFVGCDLIKNWYHGLFIRRMQCTDCKYVSNRKEMFSNISISPSSLGGESCEYVLDMMKRYISKEVFEGVECDGCKKRCDMEGVTEIDKYPLCMLLDVKRYGVRDGVYVRNNVDVGIDLGLKFVVGGGMEYKYELVCIINHIGSSPQGGHYMCCVRGSGRRWFVLDDMNAYGMDGNDLKKFGRSVYMLCYVRV